MKELDKKVITNLNIVKKFHKAPLVEALKKVENPGTGWYHLYTFDATCADPVLYVACEEEEIVLLLIDMWFPRKRTFHRSPIVHQADFLFF